MLNKDDMVKWLKDQRDSLQLEHKVATTALEIIGNDNKSAAEWVSKIKRIENDIASKDKFLKVLDTDTEFNKIIQD